MKNVCCFWIPRSQWRHARKFSLQIKGNMVWVTDIQYKWSFCALSIPLRSTLFSKYFIWWLHVWICTWLEDWHWRWQSSAVAGSMCSIFFPTDPEPVACLIVPLSGSAGNLKLLWLESVSVSVNAVLWFANIILLCEAWSQRLHLQTLTHALWPPRVPAENVTLCRLAICLVHMRFNSRQLTYQTKGTVSF